MIHYDVISNTISLCSRYYKPATFHHCLRVAKYVVNNVCLRNDDEKETAYIVALCHDLLEDTTVKLEEIQMATGYSHGFLSNVIDALTQKEDEPYIDYIKRLKQNHSPYPYIIKLADMKDHLMQKDTLTEQLKEKYWVALPELL